MPTLAPLTISDIPPLAEAIASGDRSSLATALNTLDDQRPAAKEIASALLSHLAKICKPETSRLVGMTGPPGVGKSSLTAALITYWRSQSMTIGVLAVDPSSPISGGALLGDRLRMQVRENDAGVFIRSLSSRGEFGGLSAQVLPMSLVLMAAFDVVIIETVGVGQREVDVAQLCDTTVFVAQPGSGDSVQFIKAGVLEVPHIVVVNKSDMGAVATRTLSEMQGSIQREHPDGNWSVEVLATSATRSDGVAELAALIDQRHTALVTSQQLESRRLGYQAHWVVKRVAQEFGKFGLDSLGGEAALLQALNATAAESLDVFSTYNMLREQLGARG